MLYDSRVIFFDGVCNFCNYWVNFVIKRDRQKKLKFTTLQGETARQYHSKPRSLSSVILIDKGKAYTQSSAAIRICKYLNGGWKLFYGLIIIPKLIRDYFYIIVARNRYKWFGKKNECMAPTQEIRERFLD